MAQNAYQKLQQSRLRKDKDNLDKVNENFDFWIPHCERQLDDRHNVTLSHYGALGVALWEKQIAREFVLRKAISGIQRRRLPLFDIYGRR